MKTEKIRESILGGKTSLGIELGSTRIKGILVDENNEVIAAGGYSWENKLENGIWTYHLNDVWTGMRECYRTLADDEKIKTLWNSLFKKPDALSKSASTSKRISSLMSMGAGALDGAILAWKLYRKFKRKK